jgi:hypothetical protein
MTDEQKARAQIQKERAEYWIPLRSRAMELALQEFATFKYAPKNDTEFFLRVETVVNYLETGIPEKPGS